LPSFGRSPGFRGGGAAATATSAAVATSASLFVLALLSFVWSEE